MTVLHKARLGGSLESRKLPRSVIEQSTVFDRNDINLRLFLPAEHGHLQVDAAVKVIFECVETLDIFGCKTGIQDAFGERARLIA